MGSLLSWCSFSLISSYFKAANKQAMPFENTPLMSFKLLLSFSLGIYVRMLFILKASATLALVLCCAVGDVELCWSP